MNQLLRLMLIGAMVFFASAQNLTAKTNYVDAVSGLDINDGLTPATSKKTLQAAVDVAESGDVVLAAPGVYDQGGRPEGAASEGYDSLTNRVCIDKALTLRASNGPAETLIVGQRGTADNGLASNAVRCVLATYSGTMIEGFTITNGHTMAHDDWSDDSLGGGVRCGYSGVTLSNCVLSGNAAYFGGGVYYGKALSCRFIGNTAEEWGGGAEYGTFENCLFVGNSAGTYGGAVSDGDLLVHCTVVGNSAGTGGGGTAWTAFNNSIVYYNTAPQNPNYSWGWSFDGSCTVPMPDNSYMVLADAPQFANTNDWSDLHLTLYSLCIDGGSADYTISESTDLDGQPRIAGEAPDIGAFEWQGAVLPVISFAEQSADVSEDNGPVNIGLTLSPTQKTDVTLQLSYSGSATDSDDYTGAHANITFAAYQSETNFFLDIVDDALPEYQESIIVDLQTNSSFRFNHTVHSINIFDNDGMPEISNFLIDNGTGGCSNRIVTLSFETLNEPTEYAVSEDSAFTNVTWMTIGEQSISYTLSEGYGAKTLWVRVRKPDGAGYLISLPTSASIVYGPALDIAIDWPGVRFATDGGNGEQWFSVSNNVAQGGFLARSGKMLPSYGWIDSWLSLTVTVERASQIVFTVERFSNSGYVDFSRDGETLGMENSWEPGSHNYAFELEPGERVLQWIFHGWDEGGESGTQIVADNYYTLDAVSLQPLPPRVWFKTDDIFVPETSAASVAEVLLEWPLDQPLTVNYAMSGSADNTLDYTVSGTAGQFVIQAGETNGSFTVTGIDDSEPEHGEVAVFTLADGSAYRVGQPESYEVNILANDGLIDFFELLVEGGVPETTNQVVEIGVEASTIPSHILISENDDFSESEWQEFVPGMTFTLSAGYELKTIYVKVALPKAGGGYEESDVISASIKLVVCTLPVALDTDIAVTTLVNHSWLGQTNVTHDGVDAARSAELPSVQQYAYSYMSAMVEGPSIVSFWWKVSSYSYSSYYNGYLNFLVDGSIVEYIYGVQDWALVSYTLPAGTHTLQWRYDQRKYYANDNCGWVDQLTVTPDWPEVSFTATAQSVAEDAGTAIVSLQLNRQETDPVTVPYTFSGTASYGTDYTCAPSGSVTFAVGQTSQTIAVNITDDSLPESTENVELILSPADGVLIGSPSTHTVEIQPNDGTPVITSFALQSGGMTTTSRNITLDLEATGDPIDYRLSEDPGFAGAAWTAFTEMPGFTLSSGFGDKTLYVQVRTFIDGFGYAESDPATTVVTLIPTLADALGVVTAETGGAANWFGQTETSLDGGAAQSGMSANYYNTSWVRTTIEGTGTVSFQWFFTTGYNYGISLKCLTNGVLVATVTSPGTWTPVSLTFDTPGTHTLEWQLYSYYPTTSYSTRAYVDLVDLSGWIYPQVATPLFDPLDGTLFSDTQNVTLTCATLGSQIFYTLDGSDPTTNSVVYAAPITLSETTTVKARGFLTDAPDSEIAVATYIKSTATPLFDPPSGTQFVDELQVAITSSVAGVSIRYTLDGSEPTTNSLLYTTPVTLTGNTTIHAMAFDGETPASTISAATYALQPADAPTFDPGDGLLFDDTCSVVLSDTTVGAEIRYTLDGTDPTTNSTLYTAALTLSSPMTSVRARAFKSGMAPSDVTQAVYFRRGGIHIWGDASYGMSNVPADMTNASAFAMGYYHALALRDNGTVESWGYNGNGQGNVPADLTNVISVAAGGNHSLALLANGTVEAWGYNGYFQCDVPAGLDGVMAVAGGGAHTLALRGDGTVVAWGYNYSGQCNVPVGLSNVVAIAAGNDYSLALRGDGVVEAWGYNNYGQCNVPVDLSNVVAVVAGYYHTLAIGDDGAVTAWGRNNYGERDVPPGSTQMVAVAAGIYHSAAAGEDGMMVAFGYDGYGQSQVPAGMQHVAALQARRYNTGVQFDNFTPVEAMPPSGCWIVPGNDELSVYLTSTAAGTIRYTLDSSEPTASSPVYNGHLTLSQTATVQAGLFRGSERVGEIRTADYFKRVSMPSLSPVPHDQLIPAGGTLAVSAACVDAGAAIRYTLDGSEPTADSPLYTSQLVVSGKTLVKVRAFQDGLVPSETLSAFYAEEGMLYGWGYNGSTDYTAPTNIIDAVALAAGRTHTLALMPDGAVEAWGQNDYGQCTLPSGVSNVVAVAAGYRYSLALLADGTVEAWGYNNYSQCTIPYGLADVIAIAAGDYHAVALCADGSVHAWGSNGQGQCAVPAELGACIGIEAGQYHTVALLADSTVAAWGYNYRGQSTVPAGVSNVVAVAAGDQHTLVRFRDGSATAWGYNSDQQSTIPESVDQSIAIAAGSAHTLVLSLDGSIALWGDTRYDQGEPPADLLPSVTLIDAAYNYTLLQFGTPAPVTATPPSGSWIPAEDGTLPVYLNASGDGVIRYTLDGSEPSQTSAIYTGGLLIATDTVIKARFFNDALAIGRTLTANYLKRVAIPIFTPTSGSSFIPADGTLSVALSCTTPGAEIRYTLDGSEPTSSSGIYTSPLQLAQTTTVRTRAFKTGMAPSAVSLATYAVSGDLTAWGNNTHGQTTMPSDLVGVTQIAAGFYNNAALQADQSVRVWGYSSYGVNSVPADLTNVVAVALGTYHGLALRSSGTVTAWGYNGYGQSDVPAGLLDVVAISASLYNSSALKADGSVVIWGGSGNNILEVPAAVTNVVSLDLGDNHALAVRADGTVEGWGYNGYGQCNIPTGLSNAVAVACGKYFSAVLQSDGTVMAWGQNNYGQSTVPVGLSNVVAIACGNNHTLALTVDGNVYAWGDNSYNQCNVPSGLPKVAAIDAAADETFLQYGLLSPVTVTPPAGMMVPGSGYPFPVRLHGVKLGGAVRYTLDGSTPTSSSPIYDGSIMLGDGATVKAALFVAGVQIGSTASITYPLLPGGVVFNTITVAATPEEAGTATGGGAVRKYGATTVTATVTDPEKYVFARWLRNGVPVSTLSTYTFTVTENSLLTAVFELRTFPVTVTVTPSGLGWIRGTGWWSYNVTNTLSAYPYNGCEFLGWENAQSGAPLGSALTYATAVTNELALIARFKELVTSHTVTTLTDPAGIGAVSGAGVHANGALVTFSAPPAVTNGETREVFSHYLRNGSWATSANPWNWWMSRTDPETVEVTAVYVAQPLAPKVRLVNSNLNTPVPITDNMIVSVVFDRKMDSTVAPLVTVSNRASAVVKTLPASGTWSGSYVSGDTYRCPPLAFGRSEDGDCVLRVADARDTFGGILTSTNAWSFTVDATPPVPPILKLTQSNDTWFTVGWVDYAPPEDLNGFRIYVSETSFNTFAGLNPVSYYGSSSKYYTRYNIELDKTYWVAVGPLDRAGNMETVAQPLAVCIPRALPPSVALTVTAAGADIARLDWTGYLGNSFGFEGFHVYQATEPFGTVSNMMPIATLTKYIRNYTVSGLDRNLTNWFAVVGYNTRDEMIYEVDAQPWNDPYQGLITENTTIGAAGTVTEILGMLTVSSNAVLKIPAGATLAFHQGAGIEVEQGALMANGTALRPIHFTATNHQDVALQAGDWAGVVLGPQAGTSILRHLWIDYGSGLTLDGCAPTIDACSAHYNIPAAFYAKAGSTLTTSDALLLYNGTGLLAEPGAAVSITHSIIRNNQTNAWAIADASIAALNVWWGASEPVVLTSNLVGAVSYQPMLESEPLLTPAADTVDGNRNIGDSQVSLALAARVAEAMQISEDSSFANAFFDAYASPHTVELSAGGGSKTLYIRFRNNSGQISSTVILPINYITDGPRITSANIQEGSVLKRPFQVSASAASGLGVTALRLLVDDVVISSTNTTSLSAWWDVRSLATGTHRVRIEAEDSRGQLGVSSFNVRVAVDPPPNPVLSAPANGLLTVASTVNVAGTAEPFMPVTVKRNAMSAATVTAAADGSFSTVLSLVEGENRIVATVADAFGSGRSGERKVVRDSGAPEAVTLLDDGYIQGSGIQLTWLQPATGEVPTEYRVIYSSIPFTSAQAVSNTTVWTEDTQMAVTPMFDGRWYLAVEGRDLANNRSPISNVLTNDFDATPPSFTIAYDKPSPAGLGPIIVTVESSETLTSLPTVIVTPPASTGPTMLTVAETAPSRYTCTYTVQASAGSGLLVFKVTGTDLAGNKATAVLPQGPSMILDTKAPDGVLVASPDGLIQITNTVPMQLALTLDEIPATQPVLKFTPPESLMLTVALAGSGTNWFGTLELLPSMGSGIGSFSYTATDVLGNTGSLLSGVTQIELYNTALPEPPPAVTDLRASIDQKDGVIKLAWLAVLEAESYRLYRQAEVSGSVPDMLVASNLTAATYEDLPLEDGFYRYVVCSERRGSPAEPSPIALGYSDRTPPPIPQNLTAALSSNGVRVEWEYSTSGEQPTKFRVYRNGTLIRSNITPATRFILDNPARGTWVYTVAAVDRNSNEALSNEASIDMNLPGVVRTDVIVGEDRVPRITWQTRAEHVGVNLYRNGVKLNTSPLTGTSFTDSGLSGSAVTRYEVRGVNSEGTESAARQLPVCHITSTLAVNSEAGGSALLRYFDRCEVTVVNSTSDAVFESAELELTRNISGGASLTRSVVAVKSAPSGGSTSLGITFPCASVAGEQSFAGMLEQALDDASASVRYELSFDGDTPTLGQSQIEITVENQPVAGAACAPQARFYNRSQVPVDIVMWRNGQPGDVSIRVLDADETEVNRVDVMMTKSSLIPTPDSLRGFVRIPANGSTLMLLPEIIVPEALGEQSSATIKIVASHIYTACGEAGEEIAGPLEGSLPITPRLTPYTAFGLPEHAAYRAGENLVITGYAFNRTSGLPMTNVAVNAGVALDGYVWLVEGQSDSNGNFRVAWPILPGISGLCQVWAAHPDVSDRLNHGQTSIYQAYFRPAEGNVRMAANDVLTISLNAYNPGSFTFTNLISEFSAWQIVDGVTNMLPMSVVSGVVNQVESLGLPPKQLVPIKFKLYATEEALPSFNCRFELVTPEGLRIPFDALVGVTAPIPLITVASPAKGYVDMSLDRGNTRSTDVELRNDGFKSLLGVKMTAPAVPWMQVALTPAQDGTFTLPDLAPGQIFTFQILYAPGDDVEMKYYSDALNITGTNSVATKTLNLYAKVTSKLTGSFAIHIENNLGQVVPDASIRVRSALDGTELTGFKTDANGDVDIPDLMEGRWHWQVSAAGHASQAGTSQVEADLATSVSPVLTRELVTVTFTVVPVPFTDRYEIKIEQTFSTYVPVPVLVVEPVYKNLGNVTGPFEKTFTATAKNYGLIKMTEFTVEGSQTATASLTPAISYLPVLAPMQQIEIPYTVRYWGEQSSSQESLAMASKNAVDVAVSSLSVGPLDTTPAAPQYNPCTDDFMDALGKLMSYLAAKSGSISGTRVEQMKAAINVIWKVADSDAAPVGIGDMATIYQTILCVGEMLGSSSSGGSSSAGGGGGSGGAYNNTGGGCFPAGTPVLLADGTLRPIEAVKPGDIVRTGPRNEDVARVTETYLRKNALIRELILDNGVTLQTTPEHRIWSDSRGWTLAKDIHAGDRVACLNDTIATVKDASDTGRLETVYTFELREDIAYYAHGVLVRHLCGMQFPYMTPTHGTTSKIKGGAQ
ncbi:MAG: chitobiase/beta-hexosaminidase C-terminal domain-containing protein [Kiritimatiellae bacterium]|jgi:alpha-tubulin suppressor-like RCC1 family protein|nr:chitobiase/beta-hexosaminidase C-terminal domain-containing protein [Kiritimatiellia bacterium]